MTFFVCMPVRFPRLPCAVTAWNDWNTSAFFDPTDKLVAVIAFISQNQLPRQRKGWSCQEKFSPGMQGFGIGMQGYATVEQGVSMQRAL